MQTIHPAADVKIQIGSMHFDSRLSMLLHRIEETGSVQRASTLAGISCAAAQALLHSAEVSLGEPLLLGENRLSPKGRRLLDAYDQYCAAVRKQADALYQTMLQDLLE